MGREKINLWKSVWARFVVGKSTMQLQRNLSFWVVVPLFENGFELCRCSNIRDLISEYIRVSFTRYSPSIEHVWWIFQSATIFIREKLSLIHRWSLNIWKNFDRDVWHNRSRRLNTICNYIQTKQTSKINNTRVFTYPRCTISTNCSIQFPNVTSLV